MSAPKIIKPKTCKSCGSKFVPARPLASVCSPLCGLDIARKQREKVKLSAAKVERAEIKRRKEAVKTRGQWQAEVQVVINKYVRLKAQVNGEGCYTCGATPAQKFGGTYDASHFRSVGSAPHLRFWIPQIRICCVVCNRHKGGELLAFRRALVAEHGPQWVDALEARQEVAKFSIDYLMRLKRVISKRSKRLEKSMVSIV